MDRNILKALYVILISLALALIFNFLFFSKIVGISAFIFAIILLGVLFLFGKYQQVSLRKSWWVIVLIVFFAIMPSIRANEFLTFLNVCAILGLLMILAHQLTGTPAFLMKLRDYLKLMVLGPFRMLRRALSTVSLMGQIHSNVKHRDVWLRIFKGIIMAVPILIIFAALFSQADLAFSQFLKGFIHITISERSIQYLVLLCVVFVAALSFLSYIFFPKQVAPVLSQEQLDATAKPGKGIEVLVFLGLISALFLVFIVFQITYLFGGEANIINAGFTYAEYARRGFWELLVVAMLSLVILLSSEKYAGVESKKDKQFLIPSLILVTEVVIVIVSAFKRLSLYIDAYGMTLMRFYVAGFIILLFVLFILLAVKFIKSKPEQFFAFGVLLSVLTFVVVVNIVNPDAFIARSNLKQHNKTGKIDIWYMGTLSADASREKIELYQKLSEEQKTLLIAPFHAEKESLEKFNQHWQSANLSRARALKLLNELGI